MHIPVQAIRIAQQRLDFRGRGVDGVLGPKTDERLRKRLEERRDELSDRHADEILTGARRRRLVAFIQLAGADEGIPAGRVDGLWGPQTDYAFQQLAWLTKHGELPEPWRDREPPPNPHGWPLEREADLIAAYGQPGDETRLVSVDVPWRHRLSWELTTGVTRIACHEAVADSLRRVLDGVSGHYGADRIRELRLDRFGGCFNPRPKRNGTSWSTHAWGIALDYDPDRNRLEWGRDRAAFARPEYQHWWGCWEEEGWVSLGRSANFDWMHVQAARRP